MNDSFDWKEILDEQKKEAILKIKGPVFIFGASGFVGANLFHCFRTFRDDVYACSLKPHRSWRLEGENPEQLIDVDITDYINLLEIIDEYKPDTIFNLAAYGSYSRQKKYNKIHDTNYTANINVVELLKKNGFSAYIHAGSSSEYGLNSNAPSEDEELIPNSHYAVSKASFYYALKYYGRVERLPVLNLRLYSVYGPWEEPDRLMPVLIHSARKGKLPAFVNASISRDFVFISDVIAAFVTAALFIKPEFYGNAYNIGNGVKTTIEGLAKKAIDSFKLDVKPVFGSMEDRKWDLSDWYANIAKIKRDFNWEPLVGLSDGIVRTSVWQEDIDFDSLIQRNIFQE